MGGRSILIFLQVNFNFISCHHTFKIAGLLASTKTKQTNENKRKKQKGMNTLHICPMSKESLVPLISWATLPSWFFFIYLFLAHLRK